MEIFFNIGDLAVYETDAERGLTGRERASRNVAGTRVLRERKAGSHNKGRGKRRFRGPAHSRGSVVNGDFPIEMLKFSNESYAKSVEALFFKCPY